MQLIIKYGIQKVIGLYKKLDFFWFKGASTLEIINDKLRGKIRLTLFSSSGNLFRKTLFY